MVLLWKYSFYFNGCVLVKFLSSSFFKRYYKSKDIQSFSCNWTTSTFLILNFGFSSLNQLLKFWPRLLTSIAVRFFNDILYRLGKTHV